MPSKAKMLVDLAWDEVAAHVEGAKRSVCVVTPFMSAAVADQLVAEATVSRATRFSLLTWLTEAATGSGFLDPTAVRSHLNGGCDVRSLKRLHAKVVLVDGRFGLV